MAAGVIPLLLVLLVSWPQLNGLVTGSHASIDTTRDTPREDGIAAAPPTPERSAGDATSRERGDDAISPSKPVTVSPDPSRATHVPQRGSGRLDVVSGRSGSSGQVDADFRPVSYRVEVETDLDFDRQQLAATVHSQMTNAQGWQQLAKVTFKRVDEGPVDIRVIVATPGTTDKLCEPLDTGGQYSCRVNDRVVLNASRWVEGAPAYGDAIEDYRAYLINHEVGHALGRGHASCEEPGEPAPVMMQQTKGLEECVANPWPTVHAT